MKKVFNGKCKDCKFKTKSVKGTILCPFGGIREPRNECNITKADIETKVRTYEDTLKKMKEDLDKKVIVVDLNKLVDQMEEANLPIARKLIFISILLKSQRS